MTPQKPKEVTLDDIISISTPNHPSPKDVKSIKKCIRCKKRLKEDSMYNVHDNCLEENYSEADRQTWRSPNE